MTQRTFPLEDILSCVGFYKIDNNLPIMVDGPTLVNLITFMDSRTTILDQAKMLADRPTLVVAATICGFAIVKQHAKLGKVTYPHKEIEQEHLTPWIEELRRKFGAGLTVTSEENLTLTTEEHREIEVISRILKQRLNL